MPGAPPPYGPPPQAPPPVTDNRAALSFAFGLNSLVTFGLTGIPAILLGLGAQSAIRRSQGRLGGANLASWGIATGVLGTLVGAGVIGLAVVGTVLSSGASSPVASAQPAPEVSEPAWSPTPSRAAGSRMVGAIRVVDLDPNARATFHQQLEAEYRRASSAHQTLILMTDQPRCDVCDEIAASLSDPRMQAALAHVEIVRADVEAFGEELHDSGMLEKTLPWFYKIDSTLHPSDAVSAGEWDDNVPENMAPVLGQFVAGTLQVRHTPATSQGTSL